MLGGALNSREWKTRHHNAVVGKRGSGNRGKRESMEREHFNNMLLNGLYVNSEYKVVSCL